MIKTLICDVDGCLNDGRKQHGFVNGFFVNDVWREFHSRDKTAIRSLIEKGIRVIIVSADDSAIAKAWVESCGAEFYFTPIRNEKKDISVLGEIDWKTTMGVGDDMIDWSYLEFCKYRYCPMDALSNLKFWCKKLDSKGGEGVIAELRCIINDINSKD